MAAPDKFKCIDKIRDKHNNIVMYTIINCRTGESINVSPDELKRGMSINMVIVENLKLTSDGRLIDASNNKEVAVANTQKYNKNPLEIDNAQRFSELFREICKVVLGEGSTYSDRQNLVRCIEMDYCCDYLMKLNKNDEILVGETKKYIEANYKNAEEVYLFLRSYIVDNRLAVEGIIAGNRAVDIEKNYYCNMLEQIMKLPNKETLRKLAKDVRPTSKPAIAISKAMEAKSVELRESLLYKKFIDIGQSKPTNAANWDDSITIEALILPNPRDTDLTISMRQDLIEHGALYIDTVVKEDMVFAVLPGVNSTYLELLGIKLRDPENKDPLTHRYWDYTGADVINFMRKKYALKNAREVREVIKDILKFRNEFTAKLKHYEKNVDTQTENNNSIETQNVKDKDKGKRHSGFRDLFNRFKR